MWLTYDENEYISKQYRKYLDNKLSLDKFNEQIQKKFNTDYDFRAVIKECKLQNKGSYDIGWALLDLGEK
ncbi:hypothetical protein [Paenibacillus naphthalenovorans]|uniref:Uncharacterized protein n=1 Tax=Paenibacillus naphthalenovorans TaxID=162209 RepID=A0A0U2MW91_9BACL|nr:hypothetical protein [Paenibacillus naphthalenovorans]ALS22095.1 hypothetical protein IJ22_17210 [Paenibacillus naphthalenovorans]